jgi:hypothetical protein
MVKMKKAFTIAEMLMCMLIMSVLVALSIKVFTRHHQKQMYNPVHGYFLCYKDATTGKVMQKNGSSDVEVMNSGYCSFRPVKSANYYVVYSVGGGGGGGSTYGGSQGEFTSLFLTSIADTLSIYPGDGGTYNTNGGNTYIKNPDNEIILVDTGGLLGKLNSITYENVESCEAYALPKVLENKNFKIDTSDIPKCKVGRTGIEASVCSPDIESTNQDEDINSFFDDLNTARAYYSSKSVTRSNTKYDGKYTYDLSSNRLYYVSNPVTKVLTNADRYYDGDKHALYGYSTLHNSWYYIGVPLNNNSSQSPTCVSETLSYSDILLNKDDSGRYITRTSSSSSPLFKIIIKLNKNLSETNLSSGESNSEFVTFVQNSGLLNTSFSLIKNAGKGGKVKKSGYPGAVMISW